MPFLSESLASCCRGAVAGQDKTTLGAVCLGLSPLETLEFILYWVCSKMRFLGEEEGGKASFGLL